MSWRTYGRLWPLLVGITLLAVFGAPLLVTWQASSGGHHVQAVDPEEPTVHPAMNGDVQVVVDRSSSIGRSAFSPGMTYADNTLNYPWGDNDLTAVANVKSLISGAIPFQNTPIMAWGLPDPWPDPSTPEPTDWSALDARIQLIESTGGIPVITLCEAPWWMKGQLQPGGTTHALTQDEEWSTQAFSSRILDNQMGAWLHLVQRVAERYMAAPYHVRYFQVWNELKGYYDPVSNAYDYTTSPGDPNGPNARHGYTYMYNLVYSRLINVAHSLQIPADQIKVGGPYPVMDTWSTTKQSHPSTVTKAYGTFDERPFDVLKYWLQHKVGAAFITVDVNNTNKDGVNVDRAAGASEKFADVVRWIRSLDAAVYPGAATLPIWLGEWYARPYTDWMDNGHSNAIKTFAMMEFLKAGGAVALAWGGTDVERVGPRLWTDTTRGGGTPLPFYYSYKAFRDFFAPGTALYETTITPAGGVDAVASATTVMLVNQTPGTLVVAVNGQIVPLGAYQVTVVHY